LRGPGEPGGIDEAATDIDVMLTFNTDKSERDRAEALLSSGRLILLWENPRIYVFMGEHGDHVIVDSNYCSCESFYFSLLRRSPGCYHIKALRLAPEKVAKPGRVIDVSVDEAWTIIYEALTTGFSPTLRRLLFAEDRNQGI